MHDVQRHNLMINGLLFIADNAIIDAGKNSPLTVTIIPLLGSFHLIKMIVLIGQTPVLWRGPLKQSHHHRLLCRALHYLSVKLLVPNFITAHSCL